MLKLISRKPILTTEFFTISEDTLEFDKKEIRKFKSGIRRPSSSVFPLTDKNEIYLIDEYRYIHKKRIISAVAGIIEEGESPLECAKRELKEEAGLTANNFKKLAISKAAGSFITWDQYVYLATDLELGDQNLENIEDINVIKMPLRKAVEKVVEGEIDNTITAFGILLIDRLIRSKNL